MKLEKILDQLNSFEKNSFLKIITDIISRNPKNESKIDKILSDSNKDLKNVDNINISRVFSFIEAEYSDYVQAELNNIATQFDILVDIIIRDGNCIMKQDWFSRLYENELRSLKKKIKVIETSIRNEKSDIDPLRKRDYQVYKACVHTAYFNDVKNNLEEKITDDEQSILLELARQLELSQEEIKLINYMMIPPQKLDVDTVINELKNIGVLFYSKKNNTLYVADEIVRILRQVRGKQVADKFFRRTLRMLKESQINLVCKKHNIDWRLPLQNKVKSIINEGVSFSQVLTSDIHKDSTNVTQKKSFINQLLNKDLSIKPTLKGVTLDEKIANLIKYYEVIERDEKVSISLDGYEKMLRELDEVLPKLNKEFKSEFELQDEHVLNSGLLLDYNIKPRDVLDIVSYQDLQKICKVKEISTRGDEILNILEHYKEAENLHLENYENIAFRNLNLLKENGIKIKESELGIKFEDLTKSVFNKLGFNVDEPLRRKLNTSKDKIDIVLSINETDLILIECKTVKESGYNKFSSVSRQLKSYSNLARINNYKVIKSLLVAPEFSDDFISDCELEYELNLSLITASSLIKILGGFKNSKKHKQFPYKLLMRDVLIQEDRILKAISK